MWPLFIRLPGALCHPVSILDEDSSFPLKITGRWRPWLGGLEAARGKRRNSGRCLEDTVGGERQRE